jgi:KUP system potassium uptake protein
MGHFGRKAITRAWLFVVLPALILNYLGHAALLITDKTTLSGPVLSTHPGLGALADGAAGVRRVLRLLIRRKPRE